MHHKQLLAELDRWLVHNGDKQDPDQYQIPIEEGGLRDIVVQLGETSDSYVEVWKRLVTRLRRRAGQLLDESVEQQTAYSVADYMAGVASDSRSKIQKYFNITVSHGQVRAFEVFVELSRTEEDSEKTDAEIAQAFYDNYPSAAEAVRAMADAIENTKLKNRKHYAKSLRDIDTKSCARFLTQRGVNIETDRPNQDLPGNHERRSIASVQRRLKGMERYAKHSAMLREEMRAEQAEKKNWKFAGRRQDIKDARGHHPFFTSIYDANLARQLMMAGKEWLYKPDAFVIPVPEGETRIPQSNLLIEPDFYIVNEARYIMLVVDQRFFNDALQQSSMENILLRAEIAQSSTGGKRIDIVTLEDMKKCGKVATRETLPFTVRGRNREAFNIATKPDIFLLEDCPCQVCRMNQNDNGLQAVRESIQ